MRVEKFICYGTSFIVIFSSLFLLKMSMNDDIIKSKWYECIRPTITPPRFVFPIIWTFFYGFFGVFLGETLCLTRQIASREKTNILILFFFHFVFNILWSFVYFSQKMIISSFFICLFLLSTALMIAKKTKDIFTYWNYIIWLIYSGWLLYATLLIFLSIYNIDKCQDYLQ